MAKGPVVGSRHLLQDIIEKKKKIHKPLLESERKTLYKKEVLFFKHNGRRIDLIQKCGIQESQPRTIYTTQTLTTPSVHVYNMMCTTMHGWVDGLFRSIRGCKQTGWVQALVMVIHIAVALIGNFHTDCYGCIWSH